MCIPRKIRKCASQLSTQSKVYLIRHTHEVLSFWSIQLATCKDTREHFVFDTIRIDTISFLINIKCYSIFNMVRKTNFIILFFKQEITSKQERLKDYVRFYAFVAPKIKVF